MWQGAAYGISGPLTRPEPWLDYSAVEIKVETGGKP